MDIEELATQSSTGRETIVLCSLFAKALLFSKALR
jgi:hypothetical protein